MKRSARAHRTYTRQESSALLKVRDELDSSGLRTLLQFANGDVQPTVDWPAWDSVNGEAYVEDNLGELQGWLQAKLREVIAGTFSLSPLVPVPILYGVRLNRVEVHGPDTDFADYVVWLLCEALRAGRAGRLHECRQCRRFFEARQGARYCGDTCRQSATRERKGQAGPPASPTARQAKYRAGLFSRPTRHK